MSAMLQIFANQITPKKGFSFLISLFLIFPAIAGVIVSPGMLPLIISSDKAANALQPAFTQINDIILNEMNTGDFADTKGQSKSIILTAPSGWNFKPQHGSIFFKHNSDIIAASLKVSKNSITIGFVSSGAGHLDLINISGIEIQATDGSVNCAGMIYRSSLNPGTAIIAGIKSGNGANGSCETSFGSVSQTSGMATKLVFSTKPVQSSTGTAFEQQPVIMSVDQFGNPTAKGLNAMQEVKVRLSAGTGVLSGITTLNIGTDAGNGTVSCSALQIDMNGVKKLMATSAGLTFAVSNEFTISDEEISSSLSPEDNPDWICLINYSNPASQNPGSDYITG